MVHLTVRNEPLPRMHAQLRVLDGRSETYHVDGTFGEDVAAKTNAVEILRKELNPLRRLAKPRSGFIMPGGDIGDSYQQAEKKYELTRKTLRLLQELTGPCTYSQSPRSSKETSTSSNKSTSKTGPSSALASHQCAMKSAPCSSRTSRLPPND